MNAQQSCCKVTEIFWKGAMLIDMLSQFCRGKASLNYIYHIQELHKWQNFFLRSVAILCHSSLITLKKIIKNKIKGNFFMNFILHDIEKFTVKMLLTLVPKGYKGSFPSSSWEWYDFHAEVALEVSSKQTQILNNWRRD